jgi:hypothetical protein
MTRTLLSLGMVLLLTFACGVQSAYAVGVKEAGASLLVPTYGQSMNNEIYKTKTKFMAGIEVAAITTTVVLATVSGGPVVWVGLGPLIANHVWSSADAYRGAQIKKDPAAKQRILDAQRSLELSRQQRYDSEQGYRMSLRDRILQAGQQAK